MATFPGVLPNPNSPDDPVPVTGIASPNHGDIHIGNMDPNTGEIQANAGHQAAAALDKWKSGLPGYLASQTGGAQDAAKLALARDIQNTKASANSRGLLYSGLESGGENEARAEEGSKLASNIQTINRGAEDITSQKEQLAQQEANAEDTHNLAIQQMYVDQAQSAYQLAVQDMQNQNSFYSQLWSGVGTLGGAVVGGLVGGPAGAAIGGSAGSKL